MSSALVKGMVRDHLERRARHEADAGDGEADLDEPLLVTAHHRGDDEQDDRRRDEPERPVEELEEAEEEAGRRAEPGDRLCGPDRGACRRAHVWTLSRLARSTRVESREPCGPPRLGRGLSGRRHGRQMEKSCCSSTSGSGSALIAYHTTTPRYTIGIFSASIKKTN